MIQKLRYANSLLNSIINSTLLIEDNYSLDTSGYYSGDLIRFNWNINTGELTNMIPSWTKRIKILYDGFNVTRPALYSVNLKFNSDKNSENGGIIFGWENGSNFYLVQLHSSGELSISKFKKGVAINLASAHVPNSLYTYQNVTVYEDPIVGIVNVWVNTVDVDINKPPNLQIRESDLSPGKVGIFMRGDVSIDNFKVEELEIKRESEWKLLDILNIKYIVVDHSISGFNPEDNVLLHQVTNDSSVKPEVKYDYIEVYRNTNNKPIIFAEGETSVSFVRNSYSKYIVQVKNASQTDKLIFLESYAPEWIATIGGKLLGNHTKYMGYANAWNINPEEIGKNEFTVILYFWPQSLFYFGLIISGITLIVCFGHLIHNPGGNA
jgi:hypothetical protein